jgi:hypothetical protein
MRIFMRKLAIGLVFAVPAIQFGRVAYLIFFAYSSDAASLDHLYRQAAYTITWAIQLSYLGWLGMKWRAAKRDSTR